VNIQANKKSPSTIVKPFNADCIMYLDFSDPLDIGRDCTGNNNHAINQGVEYKTDPVKTHTAYFDAKTTVLANEYGTNMSVLSLSDKIDIYKPRVYSFSFKLKLSTVEIISATKVIVAYGVNSGDVTTEDKLLLYVIGNLFKIQYKVGGVILLKLETTFTPDVFNHVVVTNGTTGHKIYINGVLITATYTTGSVNTDMNVSPYTDLSVGGAVGELDGRPDVDEYQYPFNGWLSDFSFWNRQLNATEALQLYNDNYGYCVYILAGQSNMVSRNENIADAVDSDMTKQKSKVYTYNSHGKLSNSSPYVATYEEPFLNTSANLPFLNITRDTVGLWKTFADDLITYTTLPFRKRVLLLPIAYQIDSWG
jgi:hypothetical protein